VPADVPEEYPSDRAPLEGLWDDDFAREQSPAVCGNAPEGSNEPV
jgi:hypothetical protein